MIWCGDFNGVGDATIDSTSRGIRPALQLGPWFTKLNLFDAWRCYHANEKDYTFYSPLHKSFSRIDFFLVDRQSLQLVDSSQVGTISWSDHAPIVLSLQLLHKHPVAFMWKNKTYLLRKSVTSKLEEFFALNALSVSDRFTLWNTHKAFTRGTLIQISSRWKKERSKILDGLFLSIKSLEDKLKHSPSVTHHKDLLDVRLKLRQHLMSEY